MNTIQMLKDQYGSRAVIPLDDVCRDYFTHISPRKLAQKILVGEVKLPLIRIDPTSQKAATGIHVRDLAAWIDARQAAAEKELRQMTE